MLIAWGDFYSVLQAMLCRVPIGRDTTTTTIIMVTRGMRNRPDGADDPFPFNV